MNLIMHDFAYKYKRDEVSDLVYFNRERQKLADKTIHYNDLKIKQSKIFSKLSKHASNFNVLQKKIDDLSVGLWQKCHG